MTMATKSLDELIKSGEWDTVRNWYENHPDEIKLIDPTNGSTTLHAICFIPSVPASLLEFITNANPNALTVQENRFGATPLHLLCWTSQQSATKVNILLRRMKPDDLMIRNSVSGSTVLHSACGSHADISVIQAIVRKHPPILLVKMIDQQNTAIHALWQCHIQSIPGHLHIARILKGEEVPSTRIFTRFWQKVEFLATETYKLSSSCHRSNNFDTNNAATTNDDEDDDGNDISNYVLHGLFDLKSELNAIKVATKLNPRLASYADADGNYPLHHAIIRRPFRLKDKELIQELLEAYPEAATERNNDGDVPIHIAIRDRMSWEDGLSTLVAAAATNNNNNVADVLEMPDSNTGLYPFLMCACMGGKVSVNNTFSMLIAKPDLVNGACAII